MAGSGPTLGWGGIAVAEERARAVHELSWAASLSSRFSYPILVSGTRVHDEEDVFFTWIDSL